MTSEDRVEGIAADAALLGHALVLRDVLLEAGYEVEGPLDVPCPNCGGKGTILRALVRTDPCPTCAPPVASVKALDVSARRLPERELPPRVRPDWMSGWVGKRDDHGEVLIPIGRVTCNANRTIAVEGAPLRRDEARDVSMVLGPQMVGGSTRQRFHVFPQHHVRLTQLMMPAQCADFDITALEMPATDKYRRTQMLIDAVHVAMLARSAEGHYSLGLASIDAEVGTQVAIEVRNRSPLTASFSAVLFGSTPKPFAAEFLEMRERHTTELRDALGRAGLGAWIVEAA